MSYVGTPCLVNRITDVSGHVYRAAEILDSYRNDFDTIVVSGITGMLIGPWLASIMGKNLAIVRKPGDQHSHGPSSNVEGYVGDRYIFLDDQISYGRTRDRVQRAIAEVKPNARYVGDYLYGDPMWPSRHHFTPARPTW